VLEIIINEQLDKTYVIWYVLAGGDYYDYFNGKPGTKYAIQIIR